MFFTLLFATLCIAAIVSAAAVALFNKPVGKILTRIAGLSSISMRPGSTQIAAFIISSMAGSS